MNITIDMITQSRSWTDLYKLLGVHARNTRKQKVVQDFVLTNFPDCKLKRGTYNSRGRLTDEEFAEVVANASSMRQVIVGGGWKIAGGTYIMIHDRIARLKLDTSHFKGQAHNLGRSFPSKKQPIEQYLVEDCFSINSHKLKTRLIEEGFKHHVCEICGTTQWQGRPTPIQLDHINGQRHDNRLENLRIICPNCHAQTPTYAGKNIKRVKELCPHCSTPKKINKRATCGSKQCLSKQTGQYRNHFEVDKSKAKVVSQPSKIIWPLKEQLEKMVWERSTTTIAKELGVSDNAVAKQCKKLGISKPPRGYWAKR